MHNKITMVIVALVLVAASVIGAVFVFGRNTDTLPTETTAIQATTNGGLHFDHVTGDAVIDFDDGNEKYLDTSLVAYLERMEKGIPSVDENGNYYCDENGEIMYDTSKEKDLEPVLDNLILLINHFAKEQYSVDALWQIQRFYVQYYDRFGGASFAELAEKLSVCFPIGGADAETLSDTVQRVFGFSRGDGFAFVFSPFEVAKISVPFCDVLPKEVELSEELELFCIYDNWKNEDDDGYERNLEGWLHNVIAVASEAELSIEETVAAQILYAGSLADAEYRADWSEALIRCMKTENKTYDNFKIAVETEFGVSIDGNVPLQEYFEAIGTEVSE
ncbi:MAG: hypothetical protein IJW79_05800 [Clostridia bacterium]|nr:hypothetical protein [Clostridia bacterium]